MTPLTKGLLSLHPLWQIWVLIMIVINGIAPLFFLNEPVAAVALTALIAGAIIGEILTVVNGFNKLLGLMHTPWIPMLALELMVYFKTNPTGLFAQWLLASIVISSISLVIDTLDVIQYLKSKKT